eukprot:44304_1
MAEDPEATVSYKSESCIKGTEADKKGNCAKGCTCEPKPSMSLLKSRVKSTESGVCQGKLCRKNPTTWDQDKKNPGERCGGSDMCGRGCFCDNDPDDGTCLCPEDGSRYKGQTCQKNPHCKGKDCTCQKKDRRDDTGTCQPFTSGKTCPVTPAPSYAPIRAVVYRFTAHSKYKNEECDYIRDCKPGCGCSGHVCVHRFSGTHRSERCPARPRHRAHQTFYDDWLDDHHYGLISQWNEDYDDGVYVVRDRMRLNSQSDNGDDFNRNMALSAIGLLVITCCLLACCIIVWSAFLYVFKRSNDNKRSGDSSYNVISSDRE